MMYPHHGSVVFPLKITTKPVVLTVISVLYTSWRVLTSKERENQKR